MQRRLKKSLFYSLYNNCLCKTTAFSLPQPLFMHTLPLIFLQYRKLAIQRYEINIIVSALHFPNSTFIFWQKIADNVLQVILGNTFNLKRLFKSEMTQELALTVMLSQYIQSLSASCRENLPVGSEVIVGCIQAGDHSI